MTVAMVVPHLLAPYADGQTTLALDTDAPTVGGALSAMASRYPALGDRVLTEQGAVRPHINVFVGEQNIRFADGTATTVPPGTTVMIVAAVSGG
ncbi:MAG: MoaD/ThiS family protein [Gemmatimonadales bacterium]